MQWHVGSVELASGHIMIPSISCSRACRHDNKLIERWGGIFKQQLNKSQGRDASCDSARLGGPEGDQLCVVTSSAKKYTKEELCS